MSERCALLIIGGGPAGLAAARAYRQAGGTGRVAIITDEYRIPYSRPPLTKDLLRGESLVADLPIEPEAFFDEQQIELIGGRAVTLDANQRSVTLSGGRAESYTSCLLATGAEPKRLAVPGADHPRVAVMRTLEDLRRLLEALVPQARVAVAGSGFIGCEIAASLAARGHPVELISTESAPNAARLGDGPAQVIAGWLADNGVSLHPGSGVEAIVHRDGRAIVVAGSEHIAVDLVVMGSGVAPRAELAAQAGIDLVDGAVPVDAQMRSAVDGVLAAGDMARAQNVTAGRALAVEHWGDALGQGEVAGRTAAGIDAAWDAVPGFWSTIASHTLKYVAWGDGYEQTAFVRHPNGGFTARYGAGGRLVGVLTHDADDDYERASDEVAAGTPWTA
jgi:3-phenylpropionate/trans-cinnamate dioxygenase ferredoxin reductase subunit